MKERRRRLPALVLALAVLVLALGLAPRAALAEGEVAQIGDKLYTSLQEAVDDVPADGVSQEIELISDITMTTDDIVTISEGQNITLLLRDHWIIGDSETFSGRPIVNNGTLTVDGLEGGGIDTCRSTDGRGSFYNSGTLTILGGTFRGALENEYANIWNAESAKLTVEGGTFYTSITAVNSAAGSTLEINGGYFASPWGPTIENNGNATITGGEFVNTSCSSCDKDHWAYTIRSGETNENAHLRIDYATVTGRQGGVSVVGGTADIYDGSFRTIDCSEQHGAVFYALYVAGESYKTSTTVYGGVFSSEKREAIWVGNSNPDGGNQEEATLVIKGGAFYGVSGTGDAVKVDEKLGGLSISGGWFSSNVTDYLDEGVEQGEDGTVAERPDVARVGDAGYKTLAAAIEAAKSGETVALLQDLTVDEALTIAQDKDFILNLGNYTLTLTGSTTYHDDATAAAPNEGDYAVALVNEGGLTVKNGFIKVEANDAGGIAVCGESGLLTVEDSATIYSQDMSGRALIQNFGGTVTTLGTLESTCSDVIVTYGGVVDIKDGRVFTDKDLCSAVVIFNRGYDNESAGAKVTISGGDLESDGYVASTNNVRSGGDDPSSLTVTGGRLVSRITSIYWPSAGTLTVGTAGSEAGPTITSTNGSGIEFCSGTLNVHGGTINGGTEQDEKDSYQTDESLVVAYRENSGAASAGDAITIITRRGNGYVTAPISVEITGGAFTSAQNYGVRYFDCNVPEETDNLTQDVDVAITGGDFSGILGAVDAEFIQDDDKSFISGGTFSSDVTDYLAEGFEQGEDDTVVELPDVAQVGDAGYKTLDEAIDAAKNGGTVVLLADAVDVVIPADANLTIDLNGKTITSESSHAIINNGKLALVGMGTVDGSDTSGKGAVYNAHGAVMTLTDTGLTGSKWYVVQNHGTMTMTNVSLNQEDPGSSAIDNGYPSGPNVADPYVSLTIESGTFDGGMNIVKNDDCGNLLIKDGSFTNTDGATVLNWNKATIDGGSFIATGDYAVIANGYIAGGNDEGELTINGGTFVGSNNGKGNILGYGVGGTEGGSFEIKGGTFLGEILATDYPYTPQISGGTFASEPAEEYLADGFAPIENADGTFGVLPESNIVTVTFVNGDKTTTVELEKGTKVAAQDLGAAPAGYSSFWALDGKVEAFDFNTAITTDTTLKATYVLLAPEVTLSADNTQPVTGDKVTITANVTVKAVNVKVSYQWFIDGKKVDQSAASGKTLVVSDDATVSVEVTITDAEGRQATATSRDLGVSYDGIVMYRLYNRWTGEHFYTSSVEERDTNVGLGWTDEGVGWIAPRKGTPVYRLYNPYVTGGDHHYTTSAEERDACVEAGWRYEGEAWMSADEATGVKVLRQYNPYATTGTHNYTISQDEHNYLVSVGWKDEGVGWYALK